VPNARRLLMGRSLGLAALIVMLMAAGTLASSPKAARATRVWGYGIARLVSGFTPAHSATRRDTAFSAAGFSLDNSASPSTFCPVQKSESDVAVTAGDPRKDPSADMRTASTAEESSLLPGATSRCTVPQAAAASPVRP
jgi:hypothetical protein